MNMSKKAIKSKVITTKSKTVMNFDNNHKQICVKNDFTADDKVYNKWDETRCKMIDETINNNRWDLQD